jgi:glycosyltransferase involved in cell wall biosynthesis
MNILFLSHYFPPEVNAPATRTWEHCRRWAATGYHVTVVTCAPNCPSGVVFEGYRNAWRREEVVEGIRVVRVWTYLAANQGFLPRILNYVSYMMTATWCAARLRDVDVVVATSPQFFCGWAGVWCSRLLRRPLVLEIRDLWPESIVTVGAMKRSLIIRMLEWLECRMYAAADRIVTVGEGYREQLLSKGVAADKIAVVPNGVDLDRFSPPGNSIDAHTRSASLRRRWGAGERFVCAYVGTVGMAHGLEVVLDAAGRLRDSHRDDVAFWVIGDGAERERLAAEAVRHGLDNVCFTGLVPKQEVADVLSACDACLVHLRGTELFGTVIPSKIFEALAMNVPIIMGVRGEACEIVRRAGGGVPMTSDDPQSLIDAIEGVAMAGRDAFRGGRDYVAAHYNRDRLAARMLEELQAVIEMPMVTTARRDHSPRAAA